MAIFGFGKREKKPDTENTQRTPSDQSLRGMMDRVLQEMEEKDVTEGSAEQDARFAAKKMTGSKLLAIDPVVAIEAAQPAFDRTCRELHPTNFGDVQSIINRIGINRANEFYAHLVRLKIRTHRARLQFILEELDAARQGNLAAKAFARQSGIQEAEYVDALDRSFDEVDGPGGPQQTLITLCMQLRHNMDLVVEFRTSIVKIIMKEHGFSV